MQSQQIILPAPKTAELQTQELPELKPNEWVLKAEVSLVSTGTELIIFNGEFEPGSHWDNWVKWPFTHLGYNLVGRVERVGSEVTQVQVGERFAARSPHASRRVFSGGPSDRLRRVPDAVASEDAAWFGMASIAQVGFRRAEMKFGDAVAIIGAGILGQLLTQYARLGGAREVIVIDTAPARLELAKAHGATLTFDGTADKARDFVFDATQGRGADLVFDVTGNPSAFSAGLRLPRQFGTFFLLGDAPKPNEQRLTGDVVTRGVKIIGGHDGHTGQHNSGIADWPADRMTDLFFSFLERGQMKVSDLVTHRFDFSQATTAYPMLLQDRSKALGVLFDWTKVE